MNGIDKIIAHITAEAQAECDMIAAEAAKTCERLRKEYSQLEQDEYWKVINAGAKETEQRVERLGGVASTESKKQILATKQEMVSKAFSRAAELLSTLPEQEYFDWLVKLALEAVKTGDEEIILSPRDNLAIGERLCRTVNAALTAAGKPASVSLSKKTRAMHGGLILSSEALETNCSIESILSKRRHELTSKVAEILF